MSKFFVSVLVLKNYKTLRKCLNNQNIKKKERILVHKSFEKCGKTLHAKNYVSWKYYRKTK